MVGKYIQITQCVGMLICVLWCMSATAMEFVVNEIDDLPDINLGDGVALTERGTVSLRSAIDEANLLPGEDQISFEYPVVGGGIVFGLLNVGYSLVISESVF
mgnify:CR=1 FL=1